MHQSILLRLLVVFHTWACGSMSHESNVNSKPLFSYQELLPQWHDKKCAIACLSLSKDSVHVDLNIVNYLLNVFLSTMYLNLCKLHTQSSFFNR